ncbi:hypothetical protein LOK49_LG11G02381 [Camellia lanceoleosa]|uniref:Uncharacterized protein n=1 Tax=Camellia lanceoleosa TaxID=1840588 RepID=A0ACC0G326_9ERIC|nr:hypothetical protein LOK49_LG11G02381 [Camellia lanceoleosa]
MSLKRYFVNAHNRLEEYLFPMVDIVTPNLKEASALLGGVQLETMTIYALLQNLSMTWVHGGDLASSLDVVDIFFDGDNFYELHSPRIRTRNTHGTSRTLVSVEMLCSVLFKADLNLLHLRAAFHEHIGDVMGALRDYRVAVSIDPNHEMLELHSSREP